MYKTLIVIFITLIAFSSQAIELNDDMKAFADNMENCYGVPKDEVTAWMESAQKDELALKRIAAPTEAKPWTYYKPLFVTDIKSLNGLEFYMDHLDALKKAEKIYGVDRFIICAIIGVETNYGQYPLKHRAIDTLMTLSFYYPPRAAFFQNELKQLFILSDEEGLDPLEFKSSYAGAVGIPQFMPSNIKSYGVDFDGDGKINLVSSPEDAIGSVAKYLRAHGFKKGGYTAVRADVTGDGWGVFANKGMKPKTTVNELAQAGITPQTPVDGNLKAAFYSFPLSETENENWLFFNNFYAITRYNPSVRYALAVTLLAEEIRKNAQTAADCGIL